MPLRGSHLPWHDAVAREAAEEAREAAGEEASGEAFDAAREEAVSAPPAVTLVVARARNGMIGARGRLPWHLPDDLRRFKALTMGKAVLMGRRTWASIGRPLPGRRNLVLTRDPAFEAAGATVVHSLGEALRQAGDTLMVIGGAEVYALALPHAHRIELTTVDADIEGDTHLPPFDPRLWREIAREHHAADARHAHAMDFVTLVRREAQVAPR